MEVNYIMINSTNLCTNHNIRLIKTLDNKLGIILSLFLFFRIILTFFSKMTGIGYIGLLGGIIGRMFNVSLYKMKYD